jgi:hypothetical protein
MARRIQSRDSGCLGVILFLLLGLGPVFCRAGETNYLERLKALGLAHVGGPTEAYYSRGAESRAQKLQAMIDDMNTFFQKRMGIKADVTLAVLNSPDWTKMVIVVLPEEQNLGETAALSSPDRTEIIPSVPYGLPCFAGDPPVIFMPATSGGWAYQQVMARKEAIPPEVLHAFVKSNHTTFEAAANQFVDLLGFHELGHQLARVYAVDPQVHWLDEVIATYFLYAYVSERKPEMKPVLDLFGRPSKTRPKNTSLEDFERLYLRVDDYGWYQGMFEVRVRELYPKMGLKFLEELRRRFPAATNTSKEQRANGQPATGVLLTRVLEQVEQVAPGFRAWAQGFRER